MPSNWFDEINDWLIAPITNIKTAPITNTNAVPITNTNAVPINNELF